MLPYIVLDLLSLRLSARANAATINISRTTASVRRAEQLTMDVRGVPCRPMTTLGFTTERSKQYSPSSPSNVTHPPATGVLGPHIREGLEGTSSSQQPVSQKEFQLDIKLMNQILENRVHEFEEAARKLAPVVSTQDKLPLHPSPGCIAFEDIVETPTNAEQAIGNADLSPSPVALTEGRADSSPTQTMETIMVQENEERQALWRLVGRLQAALDTFRISLSSTGTEPDVLEVLAAPLRLLSIEEWQVLSYACFFAKDVQAAKTVLNLMKRLGMSPSDKQYDVVLSLLANRGLVEEADAFVAELIPGVPSEHQRHLLAKARLKAQQFHDACTLLHSFEKRGIPAPMKSYKLVITEFLIKPGTLTTERRQQIWDLFIHMRDIVRHIPDTSLYELLIGAPPNLKLALDLFTEMTVERQMMPSQPSYNKLVKKCARSGEYLSDAFRLARHPPQVSINGIDAPPPKLSGDTLCSLMKAAAGAGDLSGAQWVLIHMLQRLRSGEVMDNTVVNFVSTYVFHAYAAFLPPSGKGSLPKPLPSTEDQDHISAPGLPRTSQEVLNEASQLWERIVADTSPAVKMKPRPLFQTVVRTPQLANAYMVVRYQHSLPSESYNTFVDLFESVGLRPDAFTYVLALEAYSNNTGLPESERTIALSIAREVWKGWLSLKRSVVQQWHTLSDVQEANLVSRAWGAMLRHLSNARRYKEAEKFLSDFVTRYPPVNPTRPASESDEEVPVKKFTPFDDRTTPYLTFFDLTPLYRHACATKQTYLVRYVSWVSYAYQGRSSSAIRSNDVYDIHYHP